MSFIVDESKLQNPTPQSRVEDGRSALPRFWLRPLLELRVGLASGLDEAGPGGRGGAAEVQDTDSVDASLPLISITKEGSQSSSSAATKALSRRQDDQQGLLKDSTAGIPMYHSRLPSHARRSSAVSPAPLPLLTRPTYTPAGARAKSSNRIEANGRRSDEKRQPLREDCSCALSTKLQAAVQAVKTCQHTSRTWPSSSPLTMPGGKTAQPDALAGAAGPRAAAAAAAAASAAVAAAAPAAHTGHCGQRQRAAQPEQPADLSAQPGAGHHVLAVDDPAARACGALRQ